MRHLPDGELVRRLEQCAGDERKATAALLATLAEFDVRRLYLPAGFSSMFDYCTRHLHLSERAASSRIAVARLARRFPVVLELIADNRVSLTVGSLLAGHLNEANYEQLLTEATHKTVSEVEVIVARLAPKPDAVAMIRKVPAPVSRAATPALTPQAPQQPNPAAAAGPLSSAVRRTTTSSVKPLAPERYRIQFTISEEARGKLRTVQELTRHSIPGGDLEAIFDRALSALLADLEKRKLAIVARPREAKSTRATSRHIPAAVRREVWRRDKGRCAYVGSEGRCRERAGLQLHHVKPFAAGGEATADNIELRCRAHNSYEAETFFGPQRHVSARLTM